MRQFVLRPGLQRGTAATNGTVQVQVSLVLLRAVSELHGGGVDYRVQVKRNWRRSHPTAQIRKFKTDENRYGLFLSFRESIDVSMIYRCSK